MSLDITSTIQATVDNWWNDPVLGKDVGIVHRVLMGAALGCSAYVALHAADINHAAGLVYAGNTWVGTGVALGVVSVSLVITSAVDTAVLLAKTAKEYAETGFKRLSRGDMEQDNTGLNEWYEANGRDTTS